MRYCLTSSVPQCIHPCWVVGSSGAGWGRGAGGGMLDVRWWRLCWVVWPSLQTSHAPVSILPPTSWQPRIAVLHHITTYTLTQLPLVRGASSDGGSEYCQQVRIWSCEWWTNTKMIWFSSDHDVLLNFWCKNSNPTFLQYLSSLTYSCIFLKVIWF